MLLKRIWQDERAFVASTDLIFLATIVGLGTIVGLATFRDQVVQEFGDLATAIGRLNQSYAFAGDGDKLTGDCYVAGSEYNDTADFCEVEEDVPAGGILVTGVALPEGKSPSPTPPQGQ